MHPQPIELLSPARDLACGFAAVDHGADAVYLGASRFGARAAAGNSVEDIARLCQYAHQFGVRVYVTVNTILYDEEIPETQQLIQSLYEVGVDALIVQDLALLRMELPPIPLHASTQMDNRTPEKVRWLRSLGFQQTVLARELTLSQISEIHQSVPDMPLEAFVHGALCVSYSGQCYASQHCFGRSANRGECAQFCRLPFTLLDGKGQVISRRRHLLSLRDMNRSLWLEQMMEAGVRSFKIEGRLKDVSYVKNVTAYYRQKLDAILQRRPEYVRSSYGSETFRFTPDPSRSFSRGFTDYFLNGRQKGMSSPLTPKSMGQEVGQVKELRSDSLVVSGTASFHNGDGLCFVDAEGELQGFRVNRAVGNRLFPAQMPAIKPHTTLYRNYDQEWERLMSQATSVRKLAVRWYFSDTPQGFTLKVLREDGTPASREFTAEHQLAQVDQIQSIREVLSKTGGTIYQTIVVEITFSQPWFIPRSLLAEWRRLLLTDLTSLPLISRQTPLSPLSDPVSYPLPTNYQANVSNTLARQFYREQGCAEVEPAMEVSPATIEKEGKTLMFCRFCLKYENGWCHRQPTHRDAPPEPYYLLSPDGRRFRLQFDCSLCQMRVVTSL